MLRKYESHIVLAIFALWVIGFAFQAGRSTQHQEDRKQIEAAYKSSHGVQDQKRTNETYPPPSGPTNSQAENRGGETPEVTFVGLKLGEGLLVFVTIWLVLVTKALVDGAKDTAERQLRAYVFLDSIDLPRLNVPGTHNMQWKIKVAWKNFGGTRTRRFIAKVSHDVLELTQRPLETFDFHDEPNAQIFHGLIGPSQSVNPPLIPICDIHLVGDDDTALLIWGWAEYQDVFNDTIHRTEFGFRVWIEGDVSGNCLVWFEPTEKHNAADEDCMKHPSSAWSLSPKRVAPIHGDTG